MSGWSNIFMQLITGAGPAVGEGLLDGWQGSIELESFGWNADLRDETEEEKAKGLGSAIGGAVASLVGLTPESRFQMHELTFTKRFDIASSQIHICLDNDLPVLSASITVLCIKQKGRAIHEPGFTLVATDGRFRECKLDLRPQGSGVELVETVTMSFDQIVMTYSKRLGKDNIPTPPFTFKRQTKKE